MNRELSARASAKKVIQLHTAITLTISSLVIACASGPDNRHQDRMKADRENIAQSLNHGEVSLAKDREELQELRKEIPSTTQKANDELAVITQLMSQPTTDPSNLRQQFQHSMQKQRESFTHKVKKLKDSFNNEERKARDAFTKQAQAKRAEINARKYERQEMQMRYQELEKERQDFFSEQRERRRSYETEINIQTKDFNDMMRMKQKEFSEQLSEYSKRYADAKREKKKSFKSELDEMEKVPSQQLGP